MNEYERMDGLIYTLIYPQKPMVKSRTLDLVNFDNIPGGQNACIAVMSYSGYDSKSATRCFYLNLVLFSNLTMIPSVEDAIILNKAAIDRGFGRCMVLRKHQSSVRRYANGTQGKQIDTSCGQFLMAYPHTDSSRPRHNLWTPFGVEFHRWS